MSTCNARQWRAFGECQPVMCHPAAQWVDAPWRAQETNVPARKSEELTTQVDQLEEARQNPRSLAKPWGNGLFRTNVLILQNESTACSLRIDLNFGPARYLGCGTMRM
jgi:hypothetical protein